AVFVTGAEPISWSEVGDWTEALEIYLDPELLPGAEVETRFDLRDAVVLGIAHVLRRAHVVDEPIADIEASTLAHRLAAHLADEYDGSRPVRRRPAGTLERRTVDQVAEYVEAQLGGTITLDQLAGVASLSPFHFARAFRASTGLAPHRFVTARRMQAARSLLLDSAVSVVDIAHSVGFTNVSHFRRVFRREHGVPPGQLRSRQQDRTSHSA
ncbi:helix-turn-helix domain-containing protein, partial [Kribbella albertanoniae]